MTMNTAQRLVKLKGKMCNNLTAMGVQDLDETQTIIELSDEILNIPPTVVGIELDTTIGCASDKQSVTVGDTVTFTGTLKAFYDDETQTDVDLEGVLQGATVKVYNGNVLLGTATTNQLGVYSYVHTVSSSGDLAIKAVFEGTDDYKDSYSSTVVVEVVAYDGIVLSSDKSILSKADNESATVTAQLMNGQSSASVSGETVTFEVRKTSDDSLVETLTGDTDSSGVATVSYLGIGAGDLYIQAFSSDRIISSQTYEIEDCSYYWDCLSDDGHWDWHSSMGRSYSSNGVTIIRSSGEGAICSKCDIVLPSEFECEFTWNGGQNYSICVNAGGGGIENQVGVKTWYYLRQCSVSSSNVITENTGTSIGDVFKIVRENGQIKYYRNDVLKGTNNLSQTDYNYLELTAYSSNRTSTIKDIKIKQL